MISESLKDQDNESPLYIQHKKILGLNVSSRKGNHHQQQQKLPEITFQTSRILAFI